MVKRAVLPLVAVAALAAAGAAGGSSQLIRHGVGIGKVRLGMTEAQVRAALGRPTWVRRSRTGFGGLRVELQFDEADWTVVLRRRGGTLRAVSVSTVLRERTREGLGVGSLESRVRRAYGARLRCTPLRTQLVDSRGEARMLVDDERDCVLPTAGGTQTVFRSEVDGRFPWSRLTPKDWVRARVYVVSVRLAGAA